MGDRVETVDEYLAALSEEQRAALVRLRADLLAVAPEATDTISYQLPALRWRGRILVCYGAAKHHCALYPMSRRIIADLADELASYSTSAGTVRFPADQPLPADLVARIVTARLAELAAKPTRR